MLSVQKVYHRYANDYYKITLDKFLKGAHYGIEDDGGEGLYRLTGFSEVGDPNEYGEVVATIEIATDNKTWKQSLIFTENGE